MSGIGSVLEASELELLVVLASSTVGDEEAVLVEVEGTGVDAGAATELAEGETHTGGCSGLRQQRSRFEIEAKTETDDDEKTPARWRVMCKEKAFARPRAVFDQ